MVGEEGSLGVVEEVEKIIGLTGWSVSVVCVCVCVCGGRQHINYIKNNISIIIVFDILFLRFQ